MNGGDEQSWSMIRAEAVLAVEAKPDGRTVITVATFQIAALEPADVVLARMDEAYRAADEVLGKYMQEGVGKVADAALLDLDLTVQALSGNPIHLIDRGFPLCGAPAGSRVTGSPIGVTCARCKSFAVPVRIKQEHPDHDEATEPLATRSVIPLCNNCRDAQLLSPKTKVECCEAHHGSKAGKGRA